jgi:gliding motility-associated-like protein
MSISSVKDSIVITATLAPIFKDSIFKNQAILKNLVYSDGTPYSQVSDNPATTKSNDSTVIKAPLLVKFSRDTVSLCATGSIGIKPAAQGRELKYAWNTKATTKEIQVSEPGTYIVTVTTDCFLAIDTQYVIKKPLKVNIGEDVTVFPGDSVPYLPDYQYYNRITKKEWTASAGAKLKCKNCFNNVAKAYGELTTVKLRLTDELGCVAEDEAQIFVRRNIYIPNSFSPNDDGINDRFFINTEKNAKIILFEIYNRWGDLVYKTDNQCFTNDYDCAWDGTYKNVAQKSDTFTYRAVIDFGDEIPFSYKGDLQIIK